MLRVCPVLTHWPFASKVAYIDPPQIWKQSVLTGASCTRLMLLARLNSLVKGRTLNPIVTDKIVNGILGDFGEANLAVIRIGAARLRQNQLSP
ncbi:hypothetical protein MUK42_23004 [Musa troglodytarum]|uniref:Uncharacterized protein n=1 Tax=Musa troglodytarum TaxID=320322 RepID=A0A9E7EH01_9LILI|nr:hypothetical protein MUK42_23004 [Musa troglodytarum]